MRATLLLNTTTERSTGSSTIKMKPSQNKLASISFTALLLLLPVLSNAHPEDDLNAPPIPGQYRMVGAVIVLLGVLILVATLFYHGHRKRQHQQRDPNSTYKARGLRPILYTVLVVEVATAIVLRTAGGNVSMQQLERMRLRGNAEDAAIEVEELLRKTPDSRRIPLLAELATDVAPGLRYASIDILRRLYPKGNEPVYEQGFRDNSSAVRERSIESLTDVNPERALPLLLAGIQDTDLSLRRTCVQKLVQLHIAHPNIVDKRAVPVLMRAFLLADALDRASLSRLLAELTGNRWMSKSVDPEPQQEAVREKWRAWWQKAEAGWGRSALDTVQSIEPERIDPAPNFALTDVDGKGFGLKEYQGRVLMINFWGTWCGPCKAELPDLKEVHKLYANAPFDLIGIALNEPDDSATGLKRRAGEMGITYRQALCTREVQRDYGEITGVPVTFLIDKQGRMRYRWEGARDSQTFRHAIDRLLKE